MIACCATVYWLGVFVDCVMLLLLIWFFGWVVNSVAVLRCYLLLRCLGIAVWTFGFY